MVSVLLVASVAKHMVRPERQLEASVASGKDRESTKNIGVSTGSFFAFLLLATHQNGNFVSFRQKRQKGKGAKK